MNLRLLAPDIQEQILFLPRIERGRAPLVLAQLQRIALVPDWRKPVSYTHLRAHENVLELVCRLLLAKKNIS